MKKKTLINLIVFSLLITSAISAKFYYVNNFNALAYKVDNIQEAREGVDNLDNKEKQALGSDFNANFIEDTSYIIEIDDQIMYGQGYYMTYNVDQNLVYCVDPLTTATRVINVDDLTNPDNTKYSKLSLDSQEKIKQILLATETIYSKTNNPEDLVAAQILVWEASGAEVIETSSNISDNMEVINQEVDETEIEDEIELNYYDTSGQDLVGDSNTQIPSVTIPGESNDDNSTSSTNQGIEFNATNGYGRVNDEDINFETFQATVIDDGKDVSDQIIVNSDDVNYSEQGRYDVTLTYERQELYLYYYVLDTDAEEPEKNQVNLYGEQAYINENDQLNENDFNEFGFYIDGNGLVIDLQTEIEISSVQALELKRSEDNDLNVGEYSVTLSATYNQIIGEDTQTLIVVDEEAILPIEDDAPYIYGEDLIIKEGNEDSIDFTNKANYNLFGYDVSDKDISDSIKLYNIDGSQELQQSDIDVYNPGIYPITLIGEDADSNQTSYIVNIVVVAEEDYPLDQNGNPYMYAKDFILYEDETGVDFTDPSNYQAFGYDMEDRDITTSIEFDIQSSDIDVSTPVIQPVTLTLSDSEGNQIEQVVNIVILKEDTRVIESCRDLESIGKGENYQGATHVNAWDYTDEYYVADDIDCAENSDTSIYGSDGFDPIGLGESGPVFSGYFNGGGHSINNLYINNSSLNSIGLFTKIESDATVENININNADVVGKNSVGLLAGHNEGTINSSSSGGKVNGSGSVGGLVGYNNGPINQSYSQALVTSTGSDTGGLVGGGSYGVINNSYATGGVTGSDNTGGLVGRGNDVSNSYATGNVIGKNQVGGLVGNSEDINNSYAIGNVFGKKYVGGLAGLLVNQHQVEYTYATGNVTGTESVGGLVGGANSRTFVGSSYSTSNVSADDLLGGLIGKTLDVTIEYSYAAGDVIGTGLVGPNDIHIGPVVSSSSIPQKCYGYENQLISNNGYDNAQNPDAATNIATYDNLTDVDNWYNDYLKWDETNAWIFGQTNDNGNFVYPSLLNDETGLLITGQEEEVITQIGT